MQSWCHGISSTLQSAEQIHLQDVMLGKKLQYMEDKILGARGISVNSNKYVLKRLFRNILQ